MMPIIFQFSCPGPFVLQIQPLSGQSLHASKHFWLVLDPSDRYLLTTMPPKQPGFSDSKSHSGPHNAYKSVCFSNSLPSPTLAFIASYLLWFFGSSDWVCLLVSLIFILRRSYQYQPQKSQLPHPPSRSRTGIVPLGLILRNSKNSL
jgi:hypothetical protein